MQWLCKLYGHTWRHPGTPEVVVAGDGHGRFEFVCDGCDRAAWFDAAEGQLRP